jgi:hypothetical protein
MTIHQLRGGWSQEELSELSRVCAVLSAAGRSLELDIGVGEFGDPWAAFCDSESHVLFHIARISGKYHFDGEALVSSGATPALMISDVLRHARWFV